MFRLFQTFDTHWRASFRGLPAWFALLVIAAWEIVYRWFSLLITDLWTPEFTDRLRCILYECSTDTDGVVTFDYQCVMDKLSGNIDPLDFTAEQLRLLIQLSYILGNIGGADGLNAAGATTHELAADCDDCEQTWCYHFDFTTGSHGWALRIDPETSHPYGVYTPGVGFQQSPDYNPWDSVGIYRDFDPANVTQFTINYDAPLEGGTARTILFFDPWDIENILSQGGGAQQVFTFDEDLTSIGTDSDPAVGFKVQWLGAITSITMRGKGENPFGESNCE